MNRFEEALAGVLGMERLEKIQRVRIGIAGAGGLGSNCASYLVRSGFKKFRIVDFDLVETGNLNRQFFFSDQVGRLKVEALAENLRRINPDLELEMLTLEIGEENAGEIFAGCAVVVEALDRPRFKKLLVEKYIDSDKLVVAVSGMAGWGRTGEFTVRRLKNNFYLVGDLVSEASPEWPPLAPGAAAAAAMQADVILTHILGQKP
ncbi:MAG: sulfur carrier protein ThiS adenylyltransferase ThiF [Firmicutes bacterium]|nr:sulfur carrier protein ThiS adenylyltransferase ThiF [Bacillota bacterium]